MGKNDRCCIDPCDNDKHHPDKIKKRSHVAAMKWYHFPKNKERRQEWIAMISKGRENFHPGKWTYVCSNHFRDGEPTTRYPNPSLFLTRNNELQATLKKRRSPAKRKTEKVKIRKLNGNQVSVSPSQKFTDLTWEYDIRFYTGLINQDIFRALFEFLKLKSIYLDILGWK